MERVSRSIGAWLILTLALFFPLHSLFAQQPLTSLPYIPSLDVQAMDRSIPACENFFYTPSENGSRTIPFPRIRRDGMFTAS